MKKLTFLSFVLFLMFSCNKEEGLSPDETIITPSASHTNLQASSRGDKVDVCHNGNIINISINAVSAHQAHGDVVDMDGDGYFDGPSNCSIEVDCDDTDATINPGITEVLCNGVDDDCNSNTPDQQAEICNNGIDDDCDGDVDEDDSDCSTCSYGLEIPYNVNFNGTFIPNIYIVTSEVVGLYNYQQAKSACENLVTPDGCSEWKLSNWQESEAVQNYLVTQSIPDIVPGNYWNIELSLNGLFAGTYNVSNPNAYGGSSYVGNSLPCFCVRQ